MTHFKIILGLFLAFMVLAAQTKEAPELSLEQLEEKLFFLVNNERSSRGLPELRFDPLLRAMARAHSQKMIQENKLGHDFPGYNTLANRAAQAGLHFNVIGENVASGNTFIMRFFHEQLMSSPGHRENILSANFRQLGIGIGRRGNVYYVSQEFANLFEPLSQLAMEREMEKKLKILFKSNIVLPRAAAAEMQEFCRRMSSLFLRDQSQETFANSYGMASILNFSFTDMESGFNIIFASVKGNKPLYWSLGVTFDRSDKNSGSVYALTLILFPDLRDALAAADGLDAVILKALNKIRYLANIPNLAKPAADIARFFYQSPDNPYFLRNKDRYKLISVYQTASLNVVPTDIAQKIIGNPKISSIGIHVFYPLAEGLPGNYFIVAILGI